MTTASPRASIFDDPITLEIVWSRVVSVADEMQAVLRRVAFSTIAGAANDLGCEIMDARGWSVAHAGTSNPSFNLALPHLVQKLLETFPLESFQPGDVVMTNDPWLVAGHESDVAVVRPFFRSGRLLGFTGSISHVTDIGGLLNQSLAKSTFEEGLFLPPVKLFEAGQRNEMLVAVIRRNVRTPEMVMGDITAQVTANGAAGRQVLALLDEYELDDLQPLSDAVQARSERAMRQAIGEIPDGDYACEATFDELDGPLTIGLVVRVLGSELLVDFVNVPPEHPHGGVNCTLSYSMARTNYGLNCLLTPHIPSNEGMFRPITIRIPEQTILNCSFPASVNDRTKVGWHIEPVLYGALAQVIPHKVPAPGGLKSTFRILGTDDHGVGFSSIMFNGGGMGASLETDGVDAICYPTSSCNVPIEIFESSTGLRVHEKEIRTDSGGPGRTRGGCGSRITIGVPTDLGRAVTVTAGCHNLGYPAFGLRGGGEAAPTRVWLNGQQLTIGQVRHELGALSLDDPTTRITLETAGGGGFGDPLMRDMGGVLSDVRNGFVSVEAAARVFGVQVDLETLTARPLPARLARTNAR
jgi:N-methylhydantoinase B/oxoprolinase/acetone carboxylase alpha subunit